MAGGFFFLCGEFGIVLLFSAICVDLRRLLNMRSCLFFLSGVLK